MARQRNNNEVNVQGAYVQIQSKKNIRVTMGLQYEDFTNENAHIPDRLKISPAWPKSNFIIKEGQHWYPSEIATWPTVQALQADGILTIGSYSDKVDDETVVKEKKTLGEAIEMLERKSLADIAGE